MSFEKNFVGKIYENDIAKLPERKKKATQDNSKRKISGKQFERGKKI